MLGVVIFRRCCSYYRLIFFQFKKQVFAFKDLVLPFEDVKFILREFKHNYLVSYFLLLIEQFLC
jgi:hypothetical protein